MKLSLNKSIVYLWIALFIAQSINMGMFNGAFTDIVMKVFLIPASLLLVGFFIYMAIQWLKVKEKFRFFISSSFAIIMAVLTIQLIIN